MNPKIEIRHLDIQDLDTVVEMASDNYLTERASANGYLGAHASSWAAKVEKIGLAGWLRINLGLRNRNSEKRL